MSRLYFIDMSELLNSKYYRPVKFERIGLANFKESISKKFNTIINYYIDSIVLLINESISESKYLFFLYDIPELEKLRELLNKLKKRFEASKLRYIKSLPSTSDNIKVPDGLNELLDDLIRINETNPLNTLVATERYITDEKINSRVISVPLEYNIDTIIEQFNKYDKKYDLIEKEIISQLNMVISTR